MKKAVKEVWIRFDTPETFEEREQELYSLLEQSKGDYEVIAYLSNSRSIKRLSAYPFDRDKVDILSEAFGMENVRVIEREETIHTYSEYQECRDSLFERMVYSLEGIEAALNTIAEHFENGGGNIASDK